MKAYLNIMKESKKKMNVFDNYECDNQMHIFDFIENPDEHKWKCVDTLEVCRHDDVCQDHNETCCKLCKNISCMARCENARK